MLPEALPEKAASNESGFALVTVIWGVGLISLLILAFTVNVRTQTKVAWNVLDSAVLEAFADAGVNLAILDLVQTAKRLPEKHRFAHNGEPVICRISDDTILKISVQDEEGKVDLNTAAEALLRALIEGLGVDAVSAARHVDALIDFRDADNLRRLNGAEKKEYEAAGKSWRPNDSPFQSVDELHRVLNLPPQLVARLIPLVTVYSNRGGIDPRVAPPALLNALSSRRHIGPGQIPTMHAISSSHRIFSVRVEASRATGGTFVRETTVELKPTAKRLYQLRRWKRGERSEDSRTPSSIRAAAIPDC